jgi:hypothetical protein
MLPQLAKESVGDLFVVIVCRECGPIWESNEIRRLITMEGHLPSTEQMPILEPSGLIKGEIVIRHPSNTLIIPYIMCFTKHSRLHT